MPLLGQMARWSFRHCRSVLGAVAGLVVLLAGLGLGVGGEWSNGGYTADGTAAQRAESAARQFGAGTPDLVLHLRFGRPVDSPEAAAQGRQLTERAAATPGVGAALSYWNTGREPLRSDDGRGALLLVDLEGDESRAARTARALVPS
ncbi:MAG: MMPL family transporter, partial [Streptomyces sp.]